MTGGESPRRCYLEIVNPSPDDRRIEKRLLDLAYTTDAKITATSLAYFAPCSIADAQRVLDDLAAHDRVEMDVQDDGVVVYHLRGRERLAFPPPPLEQRALVPIVETNRRQGPHPNPLFAALLSVLVPGAGHAYAGRFGAAIAWLVAVSVAYVLFVPGLLLHLLSIGSAANAAREKLEGGRPPRLLAA
jgi:hypothetical protein